MIYTVTFNPAIDYVVRMEKLEIGSVNRSREEALFYGGKGINVSTVLKNLGVDSVALGFVAGFTGKAIEEGVAALGVKADFITVSDGVSRINVKLKAGEETEINGKGPNISDAELEELYKKAKEEDADVVICDFYEDIGDKRKYIRQQPSDLDHKTVLRELFQQLHGSCCNKLVKRACYNGDVRFVPDLTFCEDLCFNALILRKEIKIGYLPRAFYHYEQNVNAGSLTRNSSPEQYVVLMNILEKGLDTADFQMIRPILIYSWAYKAFLMRLYTDTQFRSLFWKYQLDFFRSILLSPLCFKKVILLFISCWSTQKWAYKIYELYKLHEIRK